MIYLIRSAAYKDKKDTKCTEYETILKIGYTGEDSKKSRLDTYITENPTCQVLYLIPEGTERDERNLHHHFKNYKKYGNEWFSEEQEILDFFKTHTTKESLKELKPYRKKDNRFFKKLNELFPKLSKKYISKVLSSLKITNKYSEIVENLINKLREILEYDLDITEVDNYFKSTYPDVNFSEEVVLSTEVSNEVKKVESLTTFTEKMKFIYDFKCSDDSIKTILENLDDLNFAKYYYTIPASRAGTLNYVKGNLEKEYKSLKSYKLNINLIVDEIKSKFIVGEKYTKTYIKETLRVIYEKNGYNKTPKAIDLEKYFEIKSCLVPNKTTGKRDSGFEIIKLKDPEISTV